MKNTCCLIVLALACWLGVSAAADIKTVESWSQYRQRLLGDGKTTSEADATIAGDLRDLETMDRHAGDDRLGVPAPPFRFDDWLNSEPLSLEQLRGKVVLIRWWTDTCPFCASSAPSLRKLDARYAAQGLKVIGVFHPKAGREDPLDLSRVQRAVTAREFTFPVAVDWNWSEGTLKDWWLTGPKRPATSVTFLVDKTGVIRFVHPGMEYHDAEDTEATHDAADHAQCVRDMVTIETTIRQLLAE